MADKELLGSLGADNNNSENGGNTAGESVEKRINKFTATIKSKQEENTKLLIENLSMKDPRYKRAPEFQDAIMAKVNDGVSASDAIAAILVENNAFGAPVTDTGKNAGGDSGNGNGGGAGNNQATQNNSGSGAGGSAEIHVTDKDPKGDPKTMSQEERLTALQQAELNGEITLD